MKVEGNNYFDTQLPYWIAEIYWQREVNADPWVMQNVYEQEIAANCEKYIRAKDTQICLLFFHQNSN